MYALDRPRLGYLTDDNQCTVLSPKAACLSPLSLFVPLGVSTGYLGRYQDRARRRRGTDSLPREDEVEGDLGPVEPVQAKTTNRHSKRHGRPHLDPLPPLEQRLFPLLNQGVALRLRPIPRRGNAGGPSWNAVMSCLRRACALPFLVCAVWCLTHEMIASGDACRLVIAGVGAQVLVPEVP